MKVCQPLTSECCMKSLKLDGDPKYLFIVFTRPQAVNISKEESLWGRKIRYVSHITEYEEDIDVRHRSYFKQKTEMLFQDENGSLHESNFGKTEN